MMESNSLGKTSPKISVIVPVFNGEKYLAKAINSILDQTLLPHEVIIINDGSTDNSLLTIKDLNTPFPIKIIHQTNAGQSSARNHAARLSTGDYLAFLDQDDIWYPHHLAALFTPFEQIWKLGWVYSNLDEIDENGHMVQIGRLDSTLTEHPKKSIIMMLKQDMFILPSASLVLKQAFFEIGGFDETLCGYEDDDLFLRLFEAGWKNYYIPEPLLQWRIYSDSTSYSVRMEVSRMIYAKKLVAKYPDKPKANKFWSREYIIPRFLRITLVSYVFFCIKLKDYQRCQQLHKQCIEYMKMLPKKYRIKWQLITCLLISPPLCYFFWENLIVYIPKPIKRIARYMLAT